MMTWLILLVLLLPRPSLAALVPTSLLALEADSTCTTASQPVTSSISPTAGAVIFLVVTTETAAGIAGTVTAVANGGGIAFTEVGNALSTTTTLLRTTLLRATGVTAGTINITTVPVGGQEQANCNWQVMQWTGQDTSGTNGSGAVAQVKTNSTAGGASTLTVTFDNAFSGTTNASMGAFGFNQGGTAIIPEAGFTEIGTQSTQGSRSMFQTKNPHASDTTITVTPASGTGIFTGVIVEIKEASAVVPSAVDDTQILGSLRDFFKWLFTVGEAYAQEEPPIFPPTEPTPTEPEPTPQAAQMYYVDVNLGADCTGGNYNVQNRCCVNGTTCTGSNDGIAYNDLQDACTAIAARVSAGTPTLGDDVTIRGGTYVRGTTQGTGGFQNEFTYDCLMKGTSGDHTIITAKTCAANAAGCVLREDGNWYENVTFDNMRKVTETWAASGTANVYGAVINYVQQNGTEDNFYVDRFSTRITGGGARQVADNAANYSFSAVTVGPYRLLVDGQPSIWYDWDYTLSDSANLARLATNSHTYNRNSRTLYVRLANNGNPSSRLVETWKEDSAWMKTRLDWVDIRGMEFRGFFRFWRAANNNGQDYMHDLTVQGNQFTDMVTAISDVKGKSYTEYNGQPNVDCPTATGGGCTTYAFRARMKLYDNVFIRQGGEVFQIGGDNHEFYRNTVIDGAGQWSGGFEAYPKLNPRSSRNAKMYYNWFYGHVGSYKNAQFWVHEVTGEHYKSDASGNCEFNGQEWVGNLFMLGLRGDEVLTSAPGSAAAGTNLGSCAMNDTKFNNNIFYLHNVNDRIFRMLSTMKTSQVNNNLFYKKNAGSYIDAVSGSKWLTQTNSVTISDNIFQDGPNVMTSTACGASGVTISRNIYNGNTSNGSCTGTGAITVTPAVFANVTDLDFRPATGTPPQVVSGNDIGPYDRDTAVPTGMDYWNRLRRISPKIATVRVLEGFPSEVLIDFRLGQPRFSFGPMLAADGAAPTTTSDCAGLTVKKEGVSNPLTGCTQVNATQWRLTVQNQFACNDTGTNDVTVSYDPGVGGISDSATPVELRLKLARETDFAGTNSITTGCGVAPPAQPIFTLFHYRWKGWDGPVDGGDWLDVEDNDIRLYPGGKQRVRVQVRNSVAAGTLTPILQCNAAGGTYYDVNTDCTGNGTTEAPLCFSTTAGVTGQPDTSSQLTTCGGTYVSGKFIQSDTPHPAVTTELNGCFEVEYAVQLKENVGITQTPIKCQLTNGAGQVLPFGGGLTSAMSWGHRTSQRGHAEGGNRSGGMIR